MVCGNLMGKLRPNWFVGVRTPWTLSSKMSWNKTHRLAGWMLMLMGLLLAALAVFRTTWMLVVMVAVDVVCLAWMVIYSYLVYRRDPESHFPCRHLAGAEMRRISSVQLAELPLTGLGNAAFTGRRFHPRAIPASDQQCS